MLVGPVNIIVGSHVWIEDPGLAWIDGEVVKISGEEVHVQTTNGKTSNPVLEAFGNAKTLRNNNSSRFGKFVELQFDKSGRISGAAVRTYLLERSRVCQISDPERNYHCFYMLCAAPPEEREKFKLGDPKSFHYLNQSKCYKLDGVDDTEEYLATRRAMDVVGISEEEQDAIFRVVAAILHLGNVEFAKGKEIDSSVLKDDKSRFHLDATAELLRCDAKSLEDALIKRVMVTPEEVITRTLDPDSATGSRDALAKTIYSRLFDWLVDKINNSIGQDPNSKIIIGVLDIYGFESFKINSFEQFCINFTNEKLQQHFNQHVFKMEQEDYTKEEINWSYIEFVDNKDVLELIEKKLYQTFKNSKRFTKPKLSRTSFAISHYAGEVTYQADLFLDKNKDYVVAEHQDLLIASSDTFVAGLFPRLAEETSSKTKFSSIGSRFKSLLETLNSTEPHYIRCVKPNNVLKPAIFENVNVIQQLRCGGVLEAIRISCAGYPTKRTFYEFLNRFGVLAPEVLEGNYDDKVACRMLLDKIGLKGYELGKTKVFLRAGQMAELDARRAEVLGNAARKIQMQIRTYIAQKEFRALRGAAIVLQSNCRGKLACNLYEEMRRQAAAVKIEKSFRRHVARESYLRIRHSTIAVQTALRGMVARNEFRFRKQMKAATIIQARLRSHLAYSYYKKLQKAALASQCGWRSRLARKELRTLKMAARDTGALREAKDKLEKRVEELTWRLQLEKRQRTDLEEAKAQEYAKQQEALQAMRLQVEEANAAVIREREAARKAIEEAPPVIKETPVLVEDTEKINSLTSELEALKASLQSERQAAEDLRKAFSEAEARNSELATELENATRKADQLHESVQRLEEKLSNSESEIQVLRQQALAISPTSRTMTTRSKTMLLPRTPDNGNLLNGETKTIPDMALAVREPESEEKPQKYLNEKQQVPDNNEVLAYWLSNSATLLLLLQRTLKATGAASLTPQRRRTSSASLFGRMSQGLRASPQSAGAGLSFLNRQGVTKLDDLRQVEAKYPALLFKQQLTAFLEKIYGMIRDNLKKEISPLLGLCIQAPRTSRASLVKGRAQANAVAQQALIAHWQSSTVLNFSVMKLCSLLLRRECCSFSNGEYVKAGLAELEQWCTEATDEYAGSAWDELRHIRQAVGFLVIHQKPKKTLDEITRELCPVLSIQQLYRISTMYWDDKYGTHSVSSDVIANMRVMMTEDSNNAVSSSFLLDDDSSIPFTVEDISKSMQQVDVNDIEPPQLIRENSGFGFLLTRKEGSASNSHPNIALFVMKLEQRHIHSGPVSLDPRLHSSCASLFSSSPSVAPLSPPHSYSTATLSPPPRSHYELNSASTILNVLAPSAERYPSQASLQSERQAAEDLRKAFSEAQSRNSELATELEMLQEKQISFMNRFKGSLEKKLSNSESEIQVLRQQALPISPTSRTMATPSKAMLFTRTPENGNLLNGETKTTPDMALAVREPESEEKPQKYLNEKQQTDLEEAKAQEFAKQQEALQAMWFQVEEGNAAVIREREAARKAIEEAPPVIKETPVLVEDTEKINSLASEVEALKASLQYERKAAEDLRKAFSEAEARNSELATELENATRKADQLHESAARDTGALREAKDKLEKRVEELTWRLQLEKRQRTDLEEAKAQEYAKQQEALQAMRLQVEEANAAVIREREAARKAIEEAPPVIKETPVLVEDTEKINSLTSELEALKASLQSERQAAEDLRKAFSEAEARNSELATELENATRKADQLHESVQRLEEKLSNSESEIQVLRQQALAISPTSRTMTTRSKTMLLPRTPDNGNLLNGETKTIPDMALAVREPESEEKPQKYLNEKQQVPDNNEVLAYWLSNSATLLLLLQRTLKATGAASLTPQRRRTSSASLFGRMSQGLRASPQSAGAGLSFLNRQGVTKLDDLRQVEAKYPALLFKQQLTAFLEKIYGMIRDNLKKEISPLLGLCIQAPRTSRASLVKGRAQANAVAQQALIAHWQSIRKSLNAYLNLMKANNSANLLLRRECCSFSNGEYVKAGLDELEQWCTEATDEYAGSAWDELRHIRQAVGFLVIHQKPKKTLDEITRELCPVLSIQQLYRIITMYWDDKYGTHSVIANMRVVMTEDSNNAVSSPFLLDDDASIPFTVEDISKSMQQVDVNDIEPPPQLIRENSGFGFLLTRKEGSASPKFISFFASL
ncbi:hypothetical protein Bca4012_001045 [Brassica carinata]